MVPKFQQNEFFFLVYSSLFVIFFRWRSASAVKRAMEDKVRCIISTSKVLANEKIWDMAAETLLSVSRTKETISENYFSTDWMFNAWFAQAQFPAAFRETSPRSSPQKIIY